jgi:glycine cleavage system H lipoate-binding protein/ABC-type phosphate transport system substrate-binding protein
VKTYLKILLILKAMKKMICLLAGVLILCTFNSAGKDTIKSNKTPNSISMNIRCTPDLYKIASQWSKDFCKSHPEFNINIITVDQAGLSDLSLSGENLCFISDNYFRNLDNNGSILVIGRDILVPVISINNPFLDKINLKGVSVNELQNLINNPENVFWSSLVDNTEQLPINFYSLKNDILESEVEGFPRIKIKNVNGIEVDNTEEFIKIIQNDPYAIGLCKLNDLIISNKQEFVTKIKILPIDKNGNGKMDYFENIYSNVNDFVRGVWIGKYPKSLISNVYAMMTESSKDKYETTFLKWVLSDGQQILAQNGYTELAYNERQSNIASLSVKDNNIESEQDQFAGLKTGLFILFMLMIGGVVLYFIVTKRTKNQKALLSGLHKRSGIINEKELSSPNGLYYDKTHTWAFMEKDGIVKVGIDDFMQHITGPFTRIKMKNPGEYVKKNEYLLSLVQEGKQLNIYAPFSGKIVDINEYLITEPTRINLSPYNDGWVYKISPTNWLREIQFLQMVGNYQEWLKNEIIRIKDFLTVTVNEKKMEYGMVTFQDGGELSDNILKDLGPEVWEDFQKQFIDTSIMR